MERIKIVGINASPRKEGKTRFLLEVALKAATKEGAVTEIIDLYDIPLRPCLGCYSEDRELCGPKKCTEGELEDGMKGIQEKLLAVDGIIFATPVYWFNVSGVMKNLIDRLASLENVGKLLDGKVAGFVATAEEDGAINAIMHLMAVASDMGLLIPPYSLVNSTGVTKIEDDHEAIRDAKRLGKNMVRLIRLLEKRDFTWWEMKGDRSD
jgi:multimeric flavodoxin WrbA